MRTRIVLAEALAVSAAFVGGWATFSPHTFYTTFPLPGRHWVSSAGAYDEHLVRDVGGLYLSLLVVTVWAILRRTAEAFRVTGGAWLVFSIPHLVFHAMHTDGLGTLDGIAEVGSLAGTLVLALALLLPHASRSHSELRGGESP